ncbi:TPA: hypothetical protein ACH3X2_003773 [Trebouxia sp. C0005]
MRGTSGRQQSELSLSGVTAPVVNLCYACDMQYTQQYGVLGDPPYLSIVCFHHVLLQTNLGPMMSVMANMQRVQRLELKGNIGISGPPADSSPSTSSGLCSAIQNGLQYLDFSNMDLTGSLPKCLLSAPGTLSQSALSSIDLTDTIPDIVPTSTPLYSLVLDYNLTGSIPATLVNARDLSSLELYSKKLASW